jgi:hypothetical protein
LHLQVPRCQTFEWLSHWRASSVCSSTI